jgi:hypothetical protein
MQEGDPRQGQTFKPLLSLVGRAASADQVKGVGGSGWPLHAGSNVLILKWDGLEGAAEERYIASPADVQCRLTFRSR